MNKKMYFAFFMEEYDIEAVDFPVYMITKPVLGYLMEDESFLNILTGERYMPLEQAYAFSLPQGYALNCPLDKVKSVIKVNAKLPGAQLRNYWYQMENFLYYFDENEMVLNAMSTDYFNNKFGTNVSIYSTSEMNSFLDLLKNGEMTPEEYYDKIYKEDNKDLSEEQPLKEKIKLMPISKACEMVRKRVIAQDEAIKKLVVAIYKNLMFDDTSMKSNVLLSGPTGVGKTELVRSIANVFDIPVLIEDMTQFTDVGYKGASVDSILVNLYNNANGDLEKAERSILYLDEIDKKAAKKSDDVSSFNKEDVLHSLLKIIEGGQFQVEISDYKTITFDTSKLTVIVGGAFSGLYEEKSKVVGFDRNENFKEDNVLDINKLKDYGMPIEFLGRIRSVIKMNSLDIKDYISILKNSDISALKNYIRIFRERGIELVIPDSIYERIAKLADSYKTGARALNVIVDQMFEGILYEVFEDMDNIEKVELGENILEKNREFRLVRKK